MDSEFVKPQHSRLAPSGGGFLKSVEHHSMDVWDCKQKNGGCRAENLLLFRNPSAPGNRLFSRSPQFAKFALKGTGNVLARSPLSYIVNGNENRAPGKKDFLEILQDGYCYHSLRCNEVLAAGIAPVGS